MLLTLLCAAVCCLLCLLLLFLVASSCRLPLGSQAAFLLVLLFVQGVWTRSMYAMRSRQSNDGHVPVAKQ